MPPIWLTFSKIRVPRKEPKSKTIASRTSDPQRDPAQHLGVPCARRRRIALPQGHGEGPAPQRFNTGRPASPARLRGRPAVLSSTVLATGDDHLVYSDDSTYWGNHNSKGGKNHMGKQLMYVRSQLRLSVRLSVRILNPLIWPTCRAACNDGSPPAHAALATVQPRRPAGSCALCHSPQGSACASKMASG